MTRWLSFLSSRHESPLATPPSRKWRPDWIWGTNLSSKLPTLKFHLGGGAEREELRTLAPGLDRALYVVMVLVIVLVLVLVLVLVIVIDAQNHQRANLANSLCIAWPHDIQNIMTFYTVTLMVNTQIIKELFH